MKWNKPESIEVRMDAEISSYQDDTYDPAKDGPLFVERPAQIDRRAERTAQIAR